MRIENWDSKKMIVAVGLSTLALSLAARVASEYFDSPAPVGTQCPAANSKAGKHEHSPSTGPILHLDQLALAENVIYNGIGRDIFQNLPDPEPKATPYPPENPRPTPTDHTTPPEIPLKFFGFATMLGSPRKVFLSANGDLFIGSEGDIVNCRYRIVRVGATSIDIEDLLQQSMHILPLSIG